jgi:DNA-binding Lrp family transcriptional regulator
MKILKLIYDNNKMNPTDLSRLTGMSRGAILNQLEHLCESGFIFKYGKDYYLRDQTFSKIVELIEKDIINTLEQMKAYAKEMDDTFSEN